MKFEKEVRKSDELALKLRENLMRWKRG